MAVGGLMARPTFLPSDLIFQMSDATCSSKFDVNDDLVGAGSGKRFQQNFRLGTHEMNVEKHFGQRADGAHDCRAEGNVRHEMAVHDVKVQPVGAGTVGACGFLAKAGGVGGEQRGRDNHEPSISEQCG